MQTAEQLKVDPPVYLTGRAEFLVLLVMAGVQFAHVTDFVIMMPLGPQFLRIFQITPSQFSLLVSAYTFSAAIFSLLCALTIDRWERKKAYLAVFAGFLVGTALCGAAATYGQLLAARVVAGAFGGTVSTLCFAMVGDLIAPARRGRAMGMLMASFSVATVVGLPVGLAIAAHFGWSWTFLSIALVGAVFWGVSAAAIPRILVVSTAKRAGVLERALALFRLAVLPKSLLGLKLVAVVMSAGFLVIPFLSPALVSNVGVREQDLSWIYFVGGCFTFFSSQTIGRASDYFGHRRVFTVVASLSVFPLLLVTHLPRLTLWPAIACSTLFMVLISGRMVPTMALLTGIHPGESRAGYMSLVSFCQQLAMSVASFIAGFIVSQGNDGKLLHYPRVGYVAVALTLVALYLSTGFKDGNSAT